MATIPPIRSGAALLLSARHEKDARAHSERSLGMTVASYVLAFSLLLSVSFPAFTRSDGPFPIQESGYWTCEITSNRQCIYWLDDDRVIFSGTRPEDFETKDGRRIWNYAIYVWNHRTNRVAKYTDASPRHFCYSEGYIRYVRADQQKTTVVAGIFGKEMPTGERTVEVAEQTGWDTNLSCGTYRPQPPQPLSGYKIALKKNDGFLYFGTRTTGKEPVRYYLEGATKGLELPIARWQLSPVKVAVNRMDSSYLLYGAYRSHERDGSNVCPKTTVVRTIYRLALDGIVTEIRIPPDERFRCYVNGFAFVYGGVLVIKGGGYLDASRLYLLSKEDIREVARGAVTQHSVSPNGCRLAVGISSAGDPQVPSAPFYRGHLKVIDFCAKREP